MKKLYITMFLRSIFLQTVWNYERMQNIGFLYVIKPFIDSISNNKEEKKEIFIRHLGFFNTHPYMANIIIPICVNAEEALHNADNRYIGNMDFYKTAMASSFAALGDSFFWGTFRTFASFISVLLTISIVLAGGQDSVFNYIIPFVFLFVFNSIHIPIRCWFLFVGFSLKEQSANMFAKLQIKKLLSLIKIFGSVLIIASIVLYVFYFKDAADMNLFKEPIFNIAAFVVLFFISILLGRFAPIAKLYAFVIFSVIITMAGF
ncbi:MAG: PTS system mannose/fructose/sorbose family transporter subunit IID [Elusimicrobiota bacterium]|nr:PTS system mannose/fructose/sorbose family transporter subunit IID [Elusimicrobiota bacterium]